MSAPEAFDLEQISVDIDSMTMGEMETVEEMTGLGLDQIGELMSKPGPKVKVLMSLALIVRQRTHPETTLDDVRAMRIQLADADPKEQPATNGRLGSASLPESPFVLSGQI